MIFKKQFLILSFLFVFNQQLHALDDSAQTRAKAVCALLAVGAVQLAAHELGQKEPVKRFSAKTGLEAQDIANVGTISAGFLAASFLVKEDIADGAFQFSWRAPICAAVAASVYTKPFQNIVSNVIPGRPSLCKNEHCSGICNKCMLTKSVIFMGVYKMLDVVIDSIPGLFKTN